MKQILLYIYIGITTILAGLYVYSLVPSVETMFHSPVSLENSIESEDYLMKYSFESLRKNPPPAGTFSTVKEVADEEEYMSFLAYLDTPDGKVSGLLNVPKVVAGKRPFILLLRGYVDREIYETGIGSQRIGEELAKKGFITFSPDFLGYARSDKASDNPMEERFQAYSTTLTALASVENLNNTLATLSDIYVTADPERVGIWGHSNGGHIALSTLAITGREYPTVLWAPVSKPFPYSILYYTDEYEDNGRALRQLIADFEKNYNVELFSTPNYHEWINAPIQLHQGKQDGPVPVAWSDQLYDDLKKRNKDIEYFTYDNSDHNLAPEGWERAKDRTIQFYEEQFAPEN